MTTPLKNFNKDEQKVEGSDPRNASFIAGHSLTIGNDQLFF